MSLSDLLRRPDIVPSPYDIQSNTTTPALENPPFSPLCRRCGEYEVEIRSLRLEIDRLQGQLANSRPSQEVQVR